MLNNNHQHDIAVVGAGPAGSATAYFLARGGFDVALIDKAAFPRDKTCGDAVSPRALHVLEAMNLLNDLTARSHRITALDFYTPDGRRCAAEVPRIPGMPPYTIIAPRFMLDDAIRQKALVAGATPYQFDVTEVMRTGGRIVGVRGVQEAVSARFTVFATGATTRLLQQAGFLKDKPTLMVAARQYFECLPPLADGLEFYFDHIPLPGYGWLFPTSATTANIGAGYFGPRASSPRSLLENFYRDHPRVRDLIAEAKPVGPIKGYPLRVDFPKATLMVDGALAVGEAVGLVNPFTGEGIDYALESGQIAAECLLAAPDFTRKGLRQYERRLNDHFRHFFLITTLMRDLFYNTFMLNRLFGRGATDKYLRDSIVNICFGAANPLEAFKPKFLWAMLRP